MCNLYSITTNQAAIIALFRVINRDVGNLAPISGVFPDYPAPVVRNTDTGRELSMMRWERRSRHEVEAGAGIAIEQVLVPVTPTFLTQPFSRRRQGPRSQFRLPHVGLLIAYRGVPRPRHNSPPQLPHLQADQ